MSSNEGNCRPKEIWMNPPRYKHIRSKPAERLIERLVDATCTNLVTNTFANPHYNLETHQVETRVRECFSNIADYYAVMFHELTHSSMPTLRPETEDRLKEGDLEARGQEEMVAETCSWIICHHLKLKHNTEHSKKYIATWFARAGQGACLKANLQIAKALELFGLEDVRLVRLSTKEIESW